MKPNQPMQASRIKVLSAVVGGSAIVAMGALTFGVNDVNEGNGGSVLSDPGTFTPPETTEMTTGETTKSATQEATETVSPASASPPVTATIPPPP